MQNFGYIYKITNDINDKVYIGETTRTLDTRFNEHCFDKRSTSQIHKAIQELGWQHFKIEEIEQVPLDKIYEREAYWVKEYNSFYNGYNGTETGQSILNFENTRYYQSVHVIEPNLYFDSAESLGIEISSLTSWGKRFCCDKIRKALNDNSDFLGYHLEYINIPIEQISSIDERENWIKNLNIQFAGKHIYCSELNKEFETVGQAARFLLDNNYYLGNSKTPIQSIITTLGKQLKGDTEELIAIKDNLHFEYYPGMTKNSGSENPFQNMQIHCVELDKDFNSQKEAAQYMLDNEYWKGIKLKTARLRISDIINGVFPNYKGYSFIQK